jgi:hypothetical protein
MSLIKVTTAPAKDDLLQITGDLAAKSPGLQWHWDKYEKVFDVPEGDERTLKLDAVYVYANVSSIGKVIFSVIYYMGVSVFLLHCGVELC